MSSAVFLAALLLPAAVQARAFGGARARTQSRAGDDDGLEIVAPVVVRSSHKLAGYGPERAVDGDDRTFWLVPGGQRMEMMSYARARSHAT